MNTLDPTIELAAVGVAKRYIDGYRVAQTIIAIGNVIKAIGAGVGGLLALVSFAAISQSGSGVFIGFIGIVLGVVIGLVLFLLGVVVAAQGQLLLAALDTAVNSSPFLTDEEKTKAMSLKTIEIRKPGPPPIP